MSNEELITRKQAHIDEVHRMDPKRTALLVVDMQRGFMDPDASLLVPQAWDIVEPIKKMVDFCREAGIAVIFTQFVASPEVPCLRVDPFGPEHLPAQPGQPTGWGRPSGNCNLGQEGPESPEIIDQLRPLPGESVFTGHTYDKFYGTHLDLVLRARDIRYLMFTGIMADICVNATLLSASTRDYRVTALTDCITTLWPEILAAMFDVWGRKFARLMTAEEAHQELVRQLDAAAV